MEVKERTVAAVEKEEAVPMEMEERGADGSGERRSNADGGGGLDVGGVKERRNDALEVEKEEGRDRCGNGREEDGVKKIRAKLSFYFVCGSARRKYGEAERNILNES